MKIHCTIITRSIPLTIVSASIWNPHESFLFCFHPLPVIGWSGLVGFIPTFVSSNLSKNKRRTTNSFDSIYKIANKNLKNVTKIIKETYFVYDILMIDLLSNWVPTCFNQEIHFKIIKYVIDFVAGTRSNKCCIDEFILKLPQRIKVNRQFSFMSVPM